MSPLNIVFRVIGLILAVVGLIDVLAATLPAAWMAWLPAALKVAPDLQSAVSLLGTGSAVYLLSEIAGKRAPKSY